MAVVVGLVWLLSLMLRLMRYSCSNVNGDCGNGLYQFPLRVL